MQVLIPRGEGQGHQQPPFSDRGDVLPHTALKRPFGRKGGVVVRGVLKPPCFSGPLKRAVTDTKKERIRQLLKEPELAEFYAELGIKN